MHIEVPAPLVVMMHPAAKRRLPTWFASDSGYPAKLVSGHALDVTCFHAFKFVLWLIFWASLCQNGVQNLSKSKRYLSFAFDVL